MRLHARIVEAFEELYAGELEAHAVELARHAVEAEAVIGPDKLVRYSLMAGEQALAAYAWEDARAHFERALAGKEGQPMDAETAAIASGLGRSLAALEQYEQAAANLKRAFAYYAEVGDMARAVATVEYHQSLWLSLLMKDTLAQALELVPAGSLQSARLLYSYGLSVGTRGNRYAQAQEALEASLAIARREGDVALERRVMASYAQVDGTRMKWEQSLEKSLRVLRLTTRADDPFDTLRARVWACKSLQAIGDPWSAEEHATAMQAIAESLRDAWWLELAAWRGRTLAYLSGEWEAVHALGDRAASGGFISELAMALYQSGDFDKGKASMNAIIGSGLGDLGRSAWPMVAAWFCYISGETGLLIEAEAAARDVVAHPELPPIWLMWEMEAQAALALVAVLRHDGLTAAEQYAVLKPYDNTVTLTGTVCIGRLLGLLAHTMGNLDAAQAHFEGALAFCRKAGYRPELAWSCYDYANMLIQPVGATGQPPLRNAREKAISLLDEALSISTALGMKPLMERTAALKEQVEAGPVKAPAYPDGLSEREVEVLRLIAAGRSNREIGEALFISLNTVARHVSNIFAKTGAANRAEAASYANQKGLV